MQGVLVPLERKRAVSLADPVVARTDANVTP